MSPKLILDQRGAHMAEVPGGRQRITVPGLQGQESRSAGIDSGVASLVAELCGHERQAADGLGE